MTTTTKKPKATSEKSKLNNALLAEVLREGSDAVIVYDFDFNILAWSQAAELIFGVPAAEAVNYKFLKFIPTIDQKDASEKLRLLKEGIFVESYETQRTSLEGDLVDMWVVLNTLQDEHGDTFAIASTERDITQIKQAEKRVEKAQVDIKKRTDNRARELEQLTDLLRGEKELLRVTLASIGDAVITTDSAGNITYLNPVAEQLTGWDNSSVRGINLPLIFRILSKTTLLPVVNPVTQCLRDGDVKGLTNDTLLVRRDGRSLVIDDSAAPIFDDDGKVLGAVLIFRDVTEKRQLADQLAHQALHDSLTGLVNRREFTNRVSRVIMEQGVDGINALLYMDLDQFKIINDSCGHVAGDELLRQISLLMLSEVRGRDTLARIGGDEFGLLLEHCSISRALAIGDKLRQKVMDYRFAWNHKVFTLGVSIGAVAISQGDTLSSVLSNADAACYAAKDRGRNQVHVYHHDDKDLILRHGEMQWTTRIKNALAHDGFQLYYQPIKALNPITGELGGKDYNEILLRLVDQDKIILPDEFIPAAERYDLMGQIDRWVFKACIDKLSREKKWSNTITSINVSGQSIGNTDFHQFVISLINESKVLPSNLCFEITETAAISNLLQARYFISTLKKMGCRFSLDDFGSGLSSFAYLQTLEVDFLKIDGRFIKDIQFNPIDRVMVESIISIGHVLGLSVIAEMVENAATMGILTKLGVDYGQGYAIGHPSVL
jgi:diguanylate cyclase (GGDEF)-like protein/PAS domain S-box-containing protein